jgi:hypothetical protein
MSDIDNTKRALTLPPLGVPFEEWQTHWRLQTMTYGSEPLWPSPRRVLPLEEWAWLMNWTWDPTGEIPAGPRFTPEPKKQREDSYEL